MGGFRASAPDDYTQGAGTRDPLSNFWYTDPDTAGAVTPDSALNFSAVYRAVTLLADDIAMLPLALYQRTGEDDGDKKRVRAHPVARLLSVRPNPWQTPFEFKELMAGWQLLRGNAYAAILPGPTSFAEALIPLRPDRMKVEQIDGYRMRYTFTKPDGSTLKLTQDEVLHLRAFTTDGLVGRSVVTHARTTIGLGTMAEQYGLSQFTRKPMMSGFLVAKNGQSEEDAAASAESMRAAFSGPAGWNAIATLNGDIDWKSVGMSNEDAEFLSTRKFQITDVARWFGVPPHMLGDLERATFSNIEHQGIDYTTHSLGPWLTRWEQTIARDLLLDVYGEDFFVEFVRDALLKGDTPTRFEAYSKATGGRPWMAPDEVRNRENLPELGGEASKLIDPLNMGDRGGARTPAQDAAVNRPPAPAQTSEQED